MYKKIDAIVEQKGSISAIYQWFFIAWSMLIGACTFFALYYFFSFAFPIILIFSICFWLIGSLTLLNGYLILVILRKNNQ